jgi:hypothetical protein
VIKAGFALLIGAGMLVAAVPAYADDLVVYTTPLNLVIDQPTREDYGAGWIYDDNGLQVHVESPGSWTLTLHTDDPDLGPVDNSWDKDIADLEFQSDDMSNWVPLGDDPLDPDAIVAQGNAGSEDFFIDWRVKLRWLYDRPGEYGATLVLTLSLDS